MPRGKSGGLHMRNTGPPTPREAACAERWRLALTPRTRRRGTLRILGRAVTAGSSRLVQDFDRIGVDDRLIARTRYQLQFDLLLQELDASKLLHANSILGAGLPDILQCGDQIGIAFGVRTLPGQYIHMTTLRIELERGQLARTRSLRGQLSAERIQDFRRLQVHRPSASSSLMQAGERRCTDVAPRNNDAAPHDFLGTL